MPELLPLRRRIQLQAGPRRCQPARHRLQPVVGRNLEPLAVFSIQLELAIAAAQGLLPRGQQRIQALGILLEAGPQLAIEQGLQQACHPQPAAAGAATGQSLMHNRRSGHLG